MSYHIFDTNGNTMQSRKLISCTVLNGFFSLMISFFSLLHSFIEALLSRESECSSNGVAPLAEHMHQFLTCELPRQQPQPQLRDIQCEDVRLLVNLQEVKSARHLVIHDLFAGSGQLGVLVAPVETPGELVH